MNRLLSWSIGLTGYLECEPNRFELKENKFSKKGRGLLRKEFCDYAIKDNCVEYKKFLPMLDVKTKSAVYDLKPHALLLSARQGNRDGINRMLGGKVRIIAGYPTTENINEVLAEREILIIKKKDSSDKVYDFGFKNSDERINDFF